jgi:hypothetical protein
MCKVMRWAIIGIKDARICGRPFAQKWRHLPVQDLQHKSESARERTGNKDNSREMAELDCGR